jgi:hypothetical protein
LRRKNHSEKDFTSFVLATGHALRRKYGDAVSGTVYQLEYIATLLEMTDKECSMADVIIGYDFLEPWEKIAKGVLAPFVTVFLSLESLGKNIVGRKDRIHDAMVSNLKQFKESTIQKIEEREKALRKKMKRLFKTERDNSCAL